MQAKAAGVNTTVIDQGLFATRPLTNGELGVWEGDRLGCNPQGPAVKGRPLFCIMYDELDVQKR